MIDFLTEDTLFKKTKPTLLSVAFLSGQIEREDPSITQKLHLPFNLPCTGVLWT